MPNRPTKEYIQHMWKVRQIPPALAAWIWYYGNLSREKKRKYELLRKVREGKFRENPGRKWHHEQYVYWWGRAKNAAMMYKAAPSEARLAAWKYLAGIAAAHKVSARLSALAYKYPEKYWRLMTFTGKTGRTVKGRPRDDSIIDWDDKKARFEGDQEISEKKEALIEKVSEQVEKELAAKEHG